MVQMLISEFTKKVGLHDLAGGGIEALRWIKPILSPKELIVSLEFGAVRPSKTQPERGFATMRIIAAQNEDELVAELVITGIFAR